MKNVFSVLIIYEFQRSSFLKLFLREFVFHLNVRVNVSYYILVKQVLCYSYFIVKETEAQSPCETWICVIPNTVVSKFDMLNTLLIRNPLPQFVVWKLKDAA